MDFSMFYPNQVLTNMFLLAKIQMNLFRFQNLTKLSIRFINITRVAHVFQIIRCLARNINNKGCHLFNIFLIIIDSNEY